jgi:Lipocalin-like domain
MSSAVLYIGLIYGITKYELHIKQNICRYDSETEILTLFQVFLPCNEQKERLFLPINPISMQKKLILLSGIVAFFLLINSSCSKDNDPAPAAKTKTELIVKTTWKFSDAKVGGASVSAFLQTCQKDNILTFIAAGTGTADEGTTKCDVTDPQTNAFAWSFQTNETVLFISTPLFSGGTSTFTIVSLTDTELVVSQNITVSGTNQNAVITFVH